MQKNGFIVMAVLVLGGVAVHRAPLLANEAAPGPVQKVPDFSGKGQGIEWLGRELKLTDAQKQQIAAIHQDLDQQVSDILGNNLLSPADKKRQIGALHEGLGTRIKAVLTSDQIQIFDQLGGLKALMSHPVVVGGMQVMGRNGLEALDLTDAQKAAIERIMAQDKQGFEAAGGDVTKLRAQKQATWQRIMAVLTPAQQQKLAAAKRFEIERGPGRTPEFASLGLTADQQTRLEAIMKQVAPRADAIKEDRSLSDQERLAQMTALYQELRPQFLAVLTPEQEQKLRARLLDPSR